MRGVGELLPRFPLWFLCSARPSPIPRVPAQHRNLSSLLQTQAMATETTKKIRMKERRRERPHEQALLGNHLCVRALERNEEGAHGS
jgi:hypothetical protein